MLAQVDQYIIATIAHNVSRTTDNDLKYFIDFDMAVLGRHRDRYATYAAQIRRE
jgi:predicted metal-dependent HD superfamily phosphohydrolase